MLNPGQVNLGEIKVTNAFSCPVTVQIGDAVYQTGIDSVDKVDCTDIMKMPCVGVVERKVGVGVCVVVQSGNVINPGWSFTTKLTYHAGPGGTIVSAAALPSVPGTVVQEIGYAKDATTFVVVLDRDWIVIS